MRGMAELITQATGLAPPAAAERARLLCAGRAALIVETRELSQPGSDDELYTAANRLLGEYDRVVSLHYGLAAMWAMIGECLAQLPGAAPGRGG